MIKYSTIYHFGRNFGLLLILLFPCFAFAGNGFSNKQQQTNVIITNNTPTCFIDTLATAKEGSIQITDSLRSSTNKIDSNLTKNSADSLHLPKKSKNSLDSKVDYKSNDSIVFDLKAKKVFLYNEAEMHYENINLKSDYISINFDTRILTATGLPDSTGKISGNPIFAEDNQEIKSKEITYNFNSKKGIINEVIMKEGEGYLHGYKVKKADDKTMYLSGGCFTTCDQEHPHFGIEFTKSKLITGDKIITGPAYLTIEDVPTPLVIPFGFFPFTKKRSSGVIIPAPGYETKRGYNLRGGGYYFALSDYWDLSLIGDIYTNLSWRVNAKTNYYTRYKYKGDLDVVFEQNKQGIKNTPDYASVADFAIRWNHHQNPKANPNSTFSAAVDFVSPSFGKWSGNSTDYYSSTTSSSINYYRKLGSSFSMNLNVGESYNTQTHIFNFKLPTLFISSNQFTPFKKKKSTGNSKWYEGITIQYTLNAKNEINSPDSTLLESNIWKRMDNGIEQKIPISSSIQVLKFFTWTNSINYTERWYFKDITKYWNSDSNRVAIDTNWGFTTNRDVYFSSSLRTMVYGMANFKGKNPYIKAIRHVLTPDLKFSYSPGFGNPNFGFYRDYTKTNNEKVRYSVYENAAFASPPDRQSGSLGFSLSNRLEMKVRSKKDTANGGVKKVLLIDDLNVAMSYDFAKDSVNLSDLTVSGKTTLFKNLTINYGGTFSPYCMDTNGIKINQFLWEREKKLLKMTSSKWEFALNWHLSSKKKEESQKKPIEQDSSGIVFLSPFYNPNEILGDFVNFSIPWSLDIAYTLSYINIYQAKALGYESNVLQTLNLRGEFNLTPKWKIGFTTGYDFEHKEIIPYTSIDIYRDLHCWEMRFSWIPFGFRQSWSFTIAVKASMLKDLKYEMRNSYQSRRSY